MDGSGQTHEDLDLWFLLDPTEATRSADAQPDSMIETEEHITLATTEIAPDVSLRSFRTRSGEIPVSRTEPVRARPPRRR